MVSKHWPPARGSWHQQASKMADKDDKVIKKQKFDVAEPDPEDAKDEQYGKNVEKQMEKMVTIHAERGTALYITAQVAEALTAMPEGSVASVFNDNKIFNLSVRKANFGGFQLEWKKRTVDTLMMDSYTGAMWAPIKDTAKWQAVRRHDAAKPDEARSSAD